MSCSVVLGCRYTPLTTGPCNQWCKFYTCLSLSVTLLIVGVWQYYLFCIRSGATLCTLFMVLYFTVMVAHRYTYAPPRGRTSQYRRTCIPLSVTLYSDVAYTEFDGVGLTGFESRFFLLASAVRSLPRFSLGTLE